jgi:hypothetical protein
MSPAFDPESVNKAMASPRWSALVRTGLDRSSIGRWDPGVVRESRVLVPIDLQALYVPAGSSEPMVRVPLALSAPDGQDPPAPTPILDAGSPRPPGIHLHWAPPDALLRGSLAESGPSNRLRMPALPDRWVVLRLMVPKATDTPRVRGWVLEADTAKAVPVEDWPAGADTIDEIGRTVPAAELTGSVGGSLNWVGVYDATLNRFAFHDPLDDLSTLAPGGVEADQIAYLVAGWWSVPALDPLDGAQTTSSLSDRLHELGWALVEDREGGDRVDRSRELTRLRRESFGLETAERYALDREPGAVRSRAALDMARVVSPKRTFRPALSSFADEARVVVASEPAWPRSTLLHGADYGVPVAGTANVDNRPDAAEVGVVLGEHGDDLAAALASAALASADQDERRALERLLAAFTGHLLDRVGTSDGLVDVEEYEHAAGFVARPGGPGGTDRLQAGRQEAGSGAGRTARANAARLKSGATIGAKISAFAVKRSELGPMTLDDQRAGLIRWTGEREEVEPAAESREVIRPAPRLYLPGEPMVAVRGARRSLRHGGDGRFSPDGLLHCRWPSQVIRGVDQVIRGADLLPSLNTAAVPDEVLLLARELIVSNPYLAQWTARVAAGRNALDAPATERRLFAEAVLRFGVSGTYDGRTDAFQAGDRALGAEVRLERSLVADQLRRFSLVQGTDPDPVGVTVWSQPWVPLWLEWEATLDAADRLDGWRLGQVDEEPVAVATPPPTVQRTYRGRSPLTTATATTIAAAVRGWLAAEDARDRENEGEADEATEVALARIADAIEHLDAVAASLDGIREQLLGFAYDGGLLRPRASDGTLRAPASTGAAPQFLRAGALALTRARLVDAFGRTLELPVTRPLVPVRSGVPEKAGALRLRPRFTVPARLMFRLVDPGADGPAAAEASVDQVDPASAVNPVAGFLLPDHIDEALEVFDVTGSPLGQLTNEPIGGGVGWEIALGRDGPPDAGPLYGLEGGFRHLGFLAAGLVSADARARGGRTASPDDESALSAFLRAVDTTLWTVDAFRALGSEHIAGLVGRPIAVVRARLTLEFAPDLGLDADAVAAALADRAITVRLGELTRADDALLAYVVDDDYERVRVVDKVVANLALDTGPQRGQLGRYGTTPQVPGTRTIDHPYVVTEDELPIRPGQTVMLTLLMHPGGRVHLTSGVLPRKSLQLARDWVAPGLAVVAPSARVGPVLIDPAQVRLPKVSAFPKDQLFTRRETPSSWKDDPILAATQTALLPDLPHEVQEGYIRIAPEQRGNPS